MNPINGDLESLLKKITPKKNLYSFMSGILLVDATSESAQEMVLKHINDYDNWSGTKIDFYMPGYALREQYVSSEDDNAVPIKIGGKDYLFVKSLYDKYFSDYKYAFKFSESGYPILILIDVIKKDSNSYEIENYFTINLEKWQDIDALFRAIFYYADKNTHDKKSFYFQVLLGQHVKRVKKELKKQFGEIVTQMILVDCLKYIIHCDW